MTRSEPGWRFEDLVARAFDSMVIVLSAFGAAAISTSAGRRSIVDLPLVAVTTLFALILFAAFGIYESWRGRKKRRLVATIALAWCLVLCAACAIRPAPVRLNGWSSSWLTYWAFGTGIILIGARLLGHTVLNRVRSGGRNLRSVAIVGAGHHRNDVLHRIEGARSSGFRVAHVLDTETLNTSNFDQEMDAFVRRVQDESITEIWLALSIFDGLTVAKVVERFRDQFVNIRLVPNVQNLTPLGGDVVALLGAPAINLMASPSSRALVGKAIFDRAFAFTALAALVPAFAVIAVAIKCTSRGPVIFKQRRKGVNGRVFDIFKFRTMRVHVEEHGCVTQAKRDDPRVTRIGAFLRRTSLDELPQFFNVLRGEMSVVGPRPHALAHDDLYQGLVEDYIHRYRIKPGITGWAQVNGFRGETELLEKMQGRVNCDLYYLRNWSCTLDSLIILRTILKGFTHRNAY